MRVWQPMMQERHASCSRLHIDAAGKLSCMQWKRGHAESCVVPLLTCCCRQTHTHTHGSTLQLVHNRHSGLTGARLLHWQGNTHDDDDRKHQAAEPHVWAASPHGAALPPRPSVVLLDSSCLSVQAVHPRLRCSSSVCTRTHSRGDAQAAKCRPACACWVVEAHTPRSLSEEVPAAGRL